jgi:hypothetical protein
MVTSRAKSGPHRLKKTTRTRGRAGDRNIFLYCREKREEKKEENRRTGEPGPAPAGTELEISAIVEKAEIYLCKGQISRLS